MSNVPDVDKAFVFVAPRTSLMPFNICADADVSVFNAVSPSLADIIALTSPAVLSITDMFKLWKSCN